MCCTPAAGHALPCVRLGGAASGWGMGGAQPSLSTACAQVTINCAERGLLLLRVRDEMRMTVAAYQVGCRDFNGGLCLQALCGWHTLTSSFPLSLPPARHQTLYESSVAFGMRKALLGEQGKCEVAARLEALESSERDLTRALGEWRAKCETVEKREAERREADAKRHKEEVAYLESYARQLKAQAEALANPAAKKAAPAAVSIG